MRVGFRESSGMKLEAREVEINSFALDFIVRKT